MFIRSRNYVWGGGGGAGSGQAHVINCATIKQEGGKDSRLGLGCVRTLSSRPVCWEAGVNGTRGRDAQYVPPGGEELITKPAQGDDLSSIYQSHSLNLH